MLLEEKVKISELSEFSILTYTKIENSEVRESVFLLQILTVVVTKVAKTTKNELRQKVKVGTLGQN